MLPATCYASCPIVPQGAVHMYKEFAAEFVMWMIPVIVLIALGIMITA
ncbi:hypothetical protein [Sinosporangium siamense]|nr:hypothetical protein [Sinosporangium siamense]